MATVANPASPPALDANPNDSLKTSELEDGAPVTVFHNADNFNAIHPLASEWTLWFTKPPTGKGDNWNDLLKEVITFDSVEMFWSVWHNVAKVSELPIKADYHLFRNGVRPEWEDPQNKHGGKWAWTAKEKKGPTLNDQWLQVMLAAIGETLEDEEDYEVMGVVVNIRKGFYRIGLWTRTIGKAVPAGATPVHEQGRSADEGTAVLKRIGKRFKDSLKLPTEEMIEFTGHQDSARSGSSRAQTKLQV